MTTDGERAGERLREAKRIGNLLADEVYGREIRSRRWDIQCARNPWFSLGVHIDHEDPSITLHLPGVLVYAGRCKQPGFRFWNQIVPNEIARERQMIEYRYIVDKQNTTPSGPCVFESEWDTSRHDHSCRISEAAAQHYHDTQKGYERAWPIDFEIFTSEGEPLGRFEVDCKVVRTFVAEIVGEDSHACPQCAEPCECGDTDECQHVCVPKICTACCNEHCTCPPLGEPCDANLR